MKTVYSSGKMVSCLFVVAFHVAVVFGSGKLEHPPGTEERNIEETDFSRLKREILETLRTERSPVNIEETDFNRLKREILETLRTERSPMNIGETDFNRLKREILETVDLRTEISTKETIGGAVYIRWGRTVCNNGSDVVYDGVAGGSSFDVYGGASNYLCLPKDPNWGTYYEGVSKRSKLYGAEYENPTSLGGDNNNGQDLHNHDVTCVVCQSQTKTSVVMIPAKNQCYSGWHAEYAGYLMAEDSDGHIGRTEFICMDGSPEAVPGGELDQNGALFYQVEGVCGTLPCPPYVERREITCVVCTK